MNNSFWNLLLRRGSLLKQKWIKESDMNSRFFHRIMKARNTKKNIIQRKVEWRGFKRSRIVSIDISKRVLRKMLTIGMC